MQTITNENKRDFLQYESNVINIRLFQNHTKNLLHMSKYRYLNYRRCIETLVSLGKIKRRANKCLIKINQSLNAGI